MGRTEHAFTRLWLGGAMRRWLALAPLLLLSLLFFIAAALASTDDRAILLALAGAAVPALGLIAAWIWSMLRWRSMGVQLGLVAREAGAYPDLEGRYQGRRLVILRRTDPVGIGPRLTTVLRLEGCPEVRLPGTVADAQTVRGILAPMLGDED